MKIITTGDWHIGNIFHTNDRLPEHRHFLQWLLSQIQKHQPDALLIAGDVFDNANPSAAAQSAYYEFLADATQCCPDMQIIITSGNHDSASRLEAPRALLSRHKVEIRGTVRRSWTQTDEGGAWVVDYDDLMIPVCGKDGVKVVVLAVPYLRSDVVVNHSYSQGVNLFLRELTARARAKYPDAIPVMMAHMYAKGAEVAEDHSEKITIGGQEEVNMEGWTDHPTYLTCGHIHKRQHIWNTDWARYTGSVIPMSFAEIDYRHGVDLVDIREDRKPKVEFLEYELQHKLMILPENDEELTAAALKKLINKNIPDRNADGSLTDGFVYLAIKVKLEKVKSNDKAELEEVIKTKDAVLCKFQKIMADVDLSTISGTTQLHSIEDILDRDPMDTLKEAFMIHHNSEMSERQERMLKTIIDSIDV